MSKRRKFSVEFKQGAVEQTRQSGVSCAQVARELGVGANLLSRWRREAEQFGNRACGSVKAIACIEDQDIIGRILAHLRDKELTTPFSSATDTTISSTTADIASFRWKGIQFNSTQSARKPLRHSLVQSCSCQFSKVSKKDLQDLQCDC